MAKTFYRVINQFGLGMTADAREKDQRYAQLIKNFDTHTFKGKLVPYRSSESGDASASTRKPANFLTVSVSGTTRMYALTVVNGTDKAAVNFITDFAAPLWLSPAGNESSAGTRSTEFFMYYKNYIYGARAGTNFWRHGDITGTPSWTDSWQSVSYTNIAQGIVHSQDDTMYIPYDNKIASWDNSNFTAAALTLPDTSVVTSITEYGEFIAIATRPLSGNGRSRVYLWNRNSSLVDVSENIDWGEGLLKILENVDGELVGISQVVRNKFNQSFVFSRYLGQGRTEKLLELPTTSSSVTSEADSLPLAKRVRNKYLYFMMGAELNDVVQQGVWKFGKGPDGRYALSLDRTPNNDTALTTGNLYSFEILGDYMFIAYANSSTWALSKTDDQANYNHTSVYETLIQNEGDSSATKKLVGVSLMTEPIPSGGSCVLKYRKDSTTAGNETTLLTSSTQGDIQKSVLGSFEYKEITFVIEATDGVSVTGLSYLYEEIDSTDSVYSRK